MQVFIAGATGVLGTRLVAELTERGHEVVGLVRDDAGERAVEERGGRPHRGDLLAPESLDAGVDGADVVVHAATAIPVDVRTTDADWEATDRLRRAGTHNLLDASAAAGVDRYLQQSVCWVARQPDGSRFDEDSEPNPGRTERAALDGERIAREHCEAAGIDLGILRGGLFYSHDAGHTRLYAEQLLDGFFPIVGSGLLGRGDAVLSHCHVDNIALAFADVVESSATGTWHVVDDEPATWAEFVAALAARLGRDPPPRLPAWLARFVVGTHGVRLLTTDMPTSNEKLKREVGWEPAVADYREGLDQVVQTWEDEGTIVAVDGGYEWRGAEDG
jgi:nucleoside-diphosphate-sugar epimerase